MGLGINDYNFLNLTMGGLGVQGGMPGAVRGAQGGVIERIKPSGGDVFTRSTSGTSDPTVETPSDLQEVQKQTETYVNLVKDTADAMGYNPDIETNIPIEEALARQTQDKGQKFIIDI